MHSVFTELSLVIVVTAGVSLIMKLLRQPLILGYILAGLLVGPSAFNLIQSSSLFEAFSTIGIALLLFIIGLGLFFSSNRIIVKILSDKKEQHRLHGQIAIGVILVDDIVATLALLFVAAGKDGGLQPIEIGFLVIKGLALLGGLRLALF